MATPRPSRLAIRPQNRRAYKLQLALEARRGYGNGIIMPDFGPRRTHLRTAKGGTAYYRIGPDGDYLDVNTGSFYAQIEDTPLQLVPTCSYTVTVSSRVYIAQTPGSYDTIAQRVGSGPGGYAWWLAFNGDKPMMAFTRSSSAQHWAQSPTAVASGEYHTFTATRVDYPSVWSGYLGYFHFFVDGLYKASAGWYGDTTWTTFQTPGLYVGRFSSGDSHRQFLGHISTLRVWDRAFTPAEVMEEHLDPWGLYAPAEEVWMPGSAAPASTIIPKLAYNYRRRRVA